MSISAVPSLITLTNKCYFLSKKKKKRMGLGKGTHVHCLWKRKLVATMENSVIYSQKTKNTTTM